MVVGSYPNHEDLHEGKVYSKSANAKEVRDALAAAGLKEEDLWITTVVKYGIGNKSKLSTEQIKECAEYLDAEIETIKPKLILALGAEAFKRVMKANTKVSAFIGNPIDCPYGCKVLANHSPGAVYVQDPTKRPEFQNIFRLAKKFAEDTLTYIPYKYCLVDDPDVATEIVNYYIDKRLLDVGYDAEWRGSKYNQDEVMYTFQFCCEPHKAIILDISKDGVTENRELLDRAKPLICHPEAKRLGWAIRSDDKRLIHRGFEIPEHTLAMDGMKAMGFFDSRWGKGLETGILNFTNYRPYFTDLYLKLREHSLDTSDMSNLKFLEPAIFYDYCAGDAVSHREANLNIIKAFPQKHRKYFYEVYLPLTNYLLELEMTGMAIDVPLMHDITKKYMAKYEELHERLQNHVREVGIEDFNPNSSLQKKHLLFDILKLDPIYYTKAGKSPKARAWYDKQQPATKAQYSPSTNGKTLSTMVFEMQQQMDKNKESGVANLLLETNHHIVSTMLNMNRVSVFANKFLSQRGVDTEGFDIEGVVEDGVDDGEEEEPLKQSYWAAMSNDHHIHADFFECLKNFRSSSRPNMQNMASKVLSHIPKIFVPDYDQQTKEHKKWLGDHIIPKNIRNIFCAGDPDYRWVEVDIAGADLMIAAYLSNDPLYIKDMLDGGFHLKKAREYFNDPTVSKDDYSRYVSAKSITFRVAYTAALMSAAVPIQSEIFAESGNILSLATIEFALKTWERYERYMNYRKECNDMVRDRGCIENARGMRLTYETTDNGSIMAGYMNESLAFPIASELALFMWEISIKMKEYLKKDGVWMKYVYPVNTVHDANYWVIHKDLMKDNYFQEVCKEFFTNSVTIATGDRLGMEMSISDRWKGKEVEFSKETKWNFETETWDWKN